MSDAVVAFQPTIYEIDPAHSRAHFKVRHLMVSNVRGDFSNVSGTVVFDRNNLKNSKIEAIIDATTVNTAEPQRDAHLKSADFLDVANFPVLTFVSKTITPDGSDGLKCGYRGPHDPWCNAGGGSEGGRYLRGCERSMGQHQGRCIRNNENQP